MKTICRNIFLCGSLFLAGCAAHYQPTAVFHPQLTQKREVCANVSGNGLAIDAKLAYSVSDQFGLAVTVQNDLQKFSYGEMMAGYYQSPRPNFRWDVWGGVGIGRLFSNPDLPTISNQTLQSEEPAFTKVLVQPGFGVLGKSAEYAFACRIAYLNANDPVPTSVAHHLHIEPAATFKIGWKAIKFMFQASPNFHIGPAIYKTAPVNFTFGVQARILPKIRKYEE